MEERSSKISNKNSFVDNSTPNNSQGYINLDDLYQRFYEMYINNSKKKIFNFRNKRNGRMADNPKNENGSIALQ